MKMPDIYDVAIALVLIIGIGFMLLITSVTVKLIEFDQYREDFCSNIGFDGLVKGPTRYEGYCYKILNQKMITKDFNCINVSVGEKHECYLSEKDN